ncbi:MULTISPECIES: 3-hydroxyacyl-ACP dehydratase FabZ [unclassified Paenibacillus]|uniref:3-hydroxyacyl-ACP dehydratase FabZ n=1 Tax=unclassified Paenibacillus TaxID=185978 RepID=UPI000CFD4940|nr:MULTISPECIES: 3-hydroxyacyl-ACP dehydratase FabZ [unclassified Paenibacillus]PRA00600.1 3-hydroxyacyl-[acyl-carrier-protein] dehydratase FabZ [Paenibacillus sp. MYb63]PRA49864.1 3-hydroxyacyl-[acyl-carrier-protein] dehydratase FabZ [Paenibacillus sp. MYb67]QZN75727.1 3-hydroxyacyl-ACP dehydratase FabZ [Paenibacillus sp. DR312]
MVEIKSILPHEYPFVLVDKILDIDYMKSSRGYKNISHNEPWVTGHFPDKAIYPGVLMIETMAQVGGFIFVEPEVKTINYRMLLCGVNNLKLIRPVVPGDQLIVEASLEQSIGHIFQIKCTAYVNNVIVSKGLISLAQTEV